MRRLFFAFPSGVPGIALLLLRVVSGLTVAVAGRLCVVDPTPAGMAFLTGAVALAAGTLLVIGFLTPLAAATVVVGAAGEGLSILPACASELVGSGIAAVFGLTMLVVIMGVGPGSLSVDARAFGRREIIIPSRASGARE